MGDIAPFRVMALLARARELEARGRDIVHMEIGEPDFPTPQPIVDAGIRALRAGKTHYTAALGLPALREAISDHYETQYGARVSPERILITPGASGALQLAMGVLVGRDAGVVLSDPGYPCNRHFVRQYEGRPIGVAVGPETGYQLTPQLLTEHWDEGCVAAVVASPANPTGTLVPVGHRREMARFLAEQGGALVVDEIYHGLVYGESPGTAAALDGDCFVVNSFSKYFGMTGWRLGWLVAPEPYVQALDTLAQNIFLAAPTPAQHAALAAFSPQTLEILAARRAAFQARRDFLVPALRELGFEVPVTPQGAFYVYAQSGRFAEDSQALARGLLEGPGVAVTPGIDFGDHRPGDHLRFAYTTSLERLEQGVERISAFLGT